MRWAGRGTLGVAANLAYAEQAGGVSVVGRPAAIGGCAVVCRGGPGAWQYVRCEQR